MADADDGDLLQSRLAGRVIDGVAVDDVKLLIDQNRRTNPELADARENARGLRNLLPANAPRRRADLADRYISDVKSWQEIVATRRGMTADSGQQFLALTALAGLGLQLRSYSLGRRHLLLAG